MRIALEFDQPDGLRSVHGGGENLVSFNRGLVYTSIASQIRTVVQILNYSRVKKSR